MSFLDIVFVVFLCVIAYGNWLLCWKLSPAEPQQHEATKSKTAFRTARYLAALLWHWSIPFVFGCLAASVVSLMGIQQGLMQVTDVLDEAIQQAVQACQMEQ